MTRTPMIGEVLLSEGLITQQQLDDAIRAQGEQGGLLGRHLILSGAIGRIELYSALSVAWNAPFLDLVEFPADAALVRQYDPRQLVDQGWVPWRLRDKTLIIATSVPPTDELIERAKRGYDVTDVEVRTTPDWDIWQTVAIACREELLTLSADELAYSRPESSAISGLTWWQKAIPIGLAILLAITIIVKPPLGMMILLAAANIAFFVSVSFKSFAAIRWPFRRAHIERFQLGVARERFDRDLPVRWEPNLGEDDLPLYTILVPAFNEANIIKNLINNLDDLDYPHSKLEVLILLEEEDVDTIETTRNASPPEYVRILVVPRGEPQTKPRACNYGLIFANGEFIVIFDAEDHPESDQLHQAVHEFRQDEFERAYLDPNANKLVCTQAALNYFNADYNVITRMFAVEYSHWFDAMLPGLDHSGIPLPLGGTSNHFRTQELRELGGWDPYNVTEDADLGLRAAADGLRVSTIQSVTWEEACSQTKAWIRQRTRWIKGYMVTAAVNTRHPIEFWKKTGFRGMIGNVGLILGTPLAFLLYPIALATTLITYIGVQFIGLDLPEWLIIAGVINMLYGNLMMIVSAAITSYFRYGWRIAVFAVFLPVYWVLHSFAAWRALFQMVRDPHRWEKTPHGLDEEYETGLPR